MRCPQPMIKATMLLKTPIDSSLKWKESLRGGGAYPYISGREEEEFSRKREEMGVMARRFASKSSAIKRFVKRLKLKLNRALLQTLRSLEIRTLEVGRESAA